MATNSNPGYESTLELEQYIAQHASQQEVAQIQALVDQVQNFTTEGYHTDPMTYTANSSATATMTGAGQGKYLYLTTWLY